MHKKFGELPQWAVVGDSFPVGCAFDESNVHHKVWFHSIQSNSINSLIYRTQSLNFVCLVDELQYFKQNPDFGNPKYNTKLGVYSEGCGLGNVLMSWGHDDYMYLVIVL